jgi:uncharacterized protein
MKLDLEKGAGNFIDRCSAGEIVVAGRSYRGPLIVTVDRIVADWAPPPVANLAATHLAPALELEPEVILLGTGARQVFPPATFTHAVLSLGVGLEIMTTAAACRTFNVLVSEYRRVAAALFVE